MQKRCYKKECKFCAVDIESVHGTSCRGTFLRLMYPLHFHKIVCFVFCFTLQVESDISDIYLQLHKSFEDESKVLVSTHTTGTVMKDQLCFTCLS